MSESNSRSNPADRSIVRHALTMPGWQKSLLTLAVVFLGAGLAGQGMGMVRHKTQADGGAAPANSRGIVAQDNSPENSSAPEQKAWYEKLSPDATRVGLTFLVGFIIGWAFRAFLKMMLMISVLAAAIFAGLSYFNVMNIDMTKAQQKYESSRAWVTDQAWRLKGAVQTHLPSSGASLLGMFVGFRRKS